MLSRKARAPSGIGPPSAGLIERSTDTTMPAIDDTAHGPEADRNTGDRYRDEADEIAGADAEAQRDDVGGVGGPDRLAQRLPIALTRLGRTDHAQHVVSSDRRPWPDAAARGRRETARGRECRTPAGWRGARRASCPRTDARSRRSRPDRCRGGAPRSFGDLRTEAANVVEQRRNLPAHRQQIALLRAADCPASDTASVVPGQPQHRRLAAARRPRAPAGRRTRRWRAGRRARRRAACRARTPRWCRAARAPWRRTSSRSPWRRRPDRCRTCPADCAPAGRCRGSRGCR